MNENEKLIVVLHICPEIQKNDDKMYGDKIAEFHEKLSILWLSTLWSKTWPTNRFSPNN